LNNKIRKFKKLLTKYDFNDVNDLAGKIIIDIAEIIKVHGLNIEETFEMFTTNGTKELNFD
jgi:hypothetical protein